MNNICFINYLSFFIYHFTDTDDAYIVSNGNDYTYLDYLTNV